MNWDVTENASYFYIIWTDLKTAPSGQKGSHHSNANAKYEASWDWERRELLALVNKNGYLSIVQ